MSDIKKYDKEGKNNTYLKRFSPLSTVLDTCHDVVLVVWYIVAVAKHILEHSNELHKPPMEMKK